MEVLLADAPQTEDVTTPNRGDKSRAGSLIDLAAANITPHTSKQSGINNQRAKPISMSDQKTFTNSQPKRKQHGSRRTSDRPVSGKSRPTSGEVQPTSGKSAGQRNTANADKKLPKRKSQESSRPLRRDSDEARRGTLNRQSASVVSSRESVVPLPTPNTGGNFSQINALRETLPPSQPDACQKHDSAWSAVSSNSDDDATLSGL